MRRIGFPFTPNNRDALRFDDELGETTELKRLEEEATHELGAMLDRAAIVSHDAWCDGKFRLNVVIPFASERLYDIHCPVCDERLAIGEEVFLEKIGPDLSS